jgi:polyhydroxyalkanoate synthesis repressor PhaR
MIKDEISVKIVDAKSKKDLTVSTLLQIISEQEAGGQQLFSPELLQKLIRVYDNSMQSIVADFLSNGFLKLLSDPQKYFMPEKYGALWQELIEANMGVWSESINKFTINE